MQVTDSNQLNLTKTNKLLRQLVSYREVFLRGIVSGVGTAIGATIVATVLIAALSRAVDTVADIPILEEIVQRLEEQ